MIGNEFIFAIDRAIDNLRLGNALEPGGTPTDISERGAILALEALRDEFMAATHADARVTP